MCCLIQQQHNTIIIWTPSYKLCYASQFIYYSNLKGDLFFYFAFFKSAQITRFMLNSLISFFFLRQRRQRNLLGYAQWLLTVRWHWHLCHWIRKAHSFCSYSKVKLIDIWLWEGMIKCQILKWMWWTMSYTGSEYYKLFNHLTPQFFLLPKIWNSWKMLHDVIKHYRSKFKNDCHIKGLYLYFYNCNFIRTIF